MTLDERFKDPRGFDDFVSDLASERDDTYVLMTEVPLLRQLAKGYLKRGAAIAELQNEVEDRGDRIAEMNE